MRSLFNEKKPRRPKGPSGLFDLTFLFSNTHVVLLSKRIIQLSASRGAPVSRETSSQAFISGHSGDDAGRSIDPTDDIIIHISNIKIALSVQGNGFGVIQRSLGRGSAVSRITASLDTASGHGGDDSAQSTHFANDAVTGVRNVKIIRTVYNDVRGII